MRTKTPPLLLPSHHGSPAQAIIPDLNPVHHHHDPPHRPDQMHPDAPEDRITQLYTALAALTQTLPGAHAFTGGRSQSPENLERGYTHAFTIDFDSWADLETYATHPDHQALGAQLTALAVGGINGVLVMDLEV